MREYEFSVPANSQNHRAVLGDFVRVKTAAAEINVKLEDDLGRVVADLNLSEGMRCTLPVKFKTVRVSNNSGATVDAVLVVGVGDVDDARLSGQLDISKAATVSSVADVSVLAVTTSLLSAANLSRRELMITNLSTNSASFRIGDSNTGAARGVELLPGSTITLTTTAAIYGYNSHTGVQSVSVVEIED